MPGDLLISAMVVRPRTSSAVLAAVFEKGIGELLPSRQALLLTLLRSSLKDADRDVCLGIVRAFAPAIPEIGGPQAVQDTVQAIDDVYRWWP